MGCSLEINVNHVFACAGRRISPFLIRVAIDVIKGLYCLGGHEFCKLHSGHVF